MDRMTQRLWRGAEEPVLSVAEGTSAVFKLPLLLVAFQPPKHGNRICCDYGTWSWVEIRAMGSPVGTTES
jgi:hypothetical protein